MNKNETLETIYMLHMKDVYYYLLSLSRNKEVAEDLLQDTYYKAYIHLETFRGGEFKPWLFKIAYYTYIDWYRKSRREQAVDKDILEGHLSVQLQSAEDDYFVRYELDAWLTWTEQLNWEQRHTLILRDLYGFSYAEICDQLNMKLSSVKIAIYRARQQWKKRLEAEKNELSRSE